MRYIPLIILIFATGPALGQNELPQDVNPHIVYTGNGGTKVTKAGIDFWSGGQPPRRYRVLGMITDQRGNGRLSGNAIGSGSLAKQIRKLGGDGVIVMSQMPDYGDQIVTRMMVVKYVD